MAIKLGNVEDNAQGQKQMQLYVLIEEELEEYIEELTPVENERSVIKGVYSSISEAKKASEITEENWHHVNSELKPHAIWETKICKTKWIKTQGNSRYSFYIEVHELKTE